MKKLIHWVWSFIEILIIIYVILITSLILSRNKYGYTQFGDYTLKNINLVDERNIENVKKNDLLIVKNTNDINVGDSIYYYAVYNDNYIIKSSKVLKREDDDYSSLYTLDDDSHLTISSNKILGKESKTYKNIGGILSILESRMGFLFLVLLPIMIVFIYQIYEFVEIIRHEKKIDENIPTKDDIEIL